MGDDYPHRRSPPVSDGLFHLPAGAQPGIPADLGGSPAAWVEDRREGPVEQQLGAFVCPLHSGSVSGAGAPTQFAEGWSFWPDAELDARGLSRREPPAAECHAGGNRRLDVPSGTG